MKSLLSLLLASFLLAPVASAAESPFKQHGPLRVASSGTYLEHRDGTRFFFLADTCWTGPALSQEKDWKTYLDDRVSKGFTAIQFNMVSPWRAAPTDAEGNISYIIEGGKLALNEKFYQRLDARMQAIGDAGLLAVPVLCWGNKKGDAGKELNEEQLLELCRLEVARYRKFDVLWILAGDNQYTTDAAMWKRLGKAVFGAMPGALVTTHPTGQSFPWNDWENESWLTVLGYQSGHGDGDKTFAWLTQGPPAQYGQREKFTRPLINLEPNYEGHNGYQSRKPHSDFNVRRATYWSLLIHPTAGVTYGGHGVWSWHTRPGAEPTDHKGSGVAKVWSEAIDLPGALQLPHLRKIFDSIAWQNLRPAPQLLSDQPGGKDAGRFVACAATPDHQEIILYLPAGGVAPLKPLAGADKAKMEWWNPRTGEKHANAAELKAPDDMDWVLVIRR